MADGATPFGDYLLIDRIRGGGMSEVWRARPRTGPDAIVALKRMLPRIAEDHEYLSMFLNEARLTVQLAHPNIAQVFDLGRVGGDYYIAMEYVPGEDLRTVAARGGLPIPLVALVMARICDALDYAHRKVDPEGRPLGIVHRDVSPDNCLVTFDGEVKLIDFGVAKSGPGSGTHGGTLKGKLAYMSPEQVLGLPVDARSDLFSVGVVLHELLCGRALFARESDFATLKAVCESSIPAPGDLNPHVPPELERLVLRALARDRLQRPQSAAELAEGLRSFLSGVSPHPTTGQLQRFMGVTFARELAQEKARRKAWARLATRHTPAPGEALEGEGTSWPESNPTILESRPDENPFEELAAELATSDPSPAFPAGVLPEMIVPDLLLSPPEELPPPMPSPRPLVATEPPAPDDLPRPSSVLLSSPFWLQPPDVSPAPAAEGPPDEVIITIEVPAGPEAAVEPEQPKPAPTSAPEPSPLPSPEDFAPPPPEPTAPTLPARPTSEAVTVPPPARTAAPLPRFRRPVEVNALRRWRRSMVSIAVKGRFWDSARTEARLSGTILTLSIGGALVRTPAQVSANSAVELVVPLGVFKSVAVRGVVRWWGRVGTERNLGIEFEEPRPELEKILPRE